jgi:hypothetical protein
MKLLAFVAVALVSGVAVTAGAIALGSSGHAAKAPGVQRLTMRFMPGDRMLGSNLLVRPGPVELTIVSSARHAHMFSVPALGIERVVLPGSPTAPTRPG